jgi:hypothetical protein
MMLYTQSIYGTGHVSASSAIIAQNGNKFAAYTILELSNHRQLRYGLNLLQVHIDVANICVYISDIYTFPTRGEGNFRGMRYISNQLRECHI